MPKSPSADREVLTLEEARQILRWGKNKALAAARDGSFPGLLPRIGRHYRVSRARLLEFVGGLAEQDLGGDAA